MKNSFSVSKSDHVIFVLFACWLLVDSFNGYMLRNDLFSISQLYKSIVALIIVIRSRNCNKIVMPLCVMISYGSLYFSFIALIEEDVIQSIILLSRFMTSLLFFFYFIQIKRDNNYFYKNNVFLVMKWNVIVLSVNILMGLWGYGYHSYGGEGGFGSHGFLYSINELSGVIGATFPWVMYYCKQKYSFPKYMFCVLFLFFLSFSMSTKSGIVTTIMSYLLITMFYGMKKEKMIVALILILALLGCIIYISTILESNTAIMQRFVYFMEKDGLEVALTSGRLQYWENEKGELFKSGILPLLFGLGGGRTVEMDPFDVLLNCGVLGLVFVVILYLTLLITPFSPKYSGLKYSKVVFTSNLMLIIVSIGAGHILFSSTAGMLIALSNSMLFGYNKNIKH